MRALRVAKNAFSNHARFLAFAVISFLLTPLMVHVLGKSGYGLWITVFSFTGYFGLVDQGLRPSLVRYVSRDRARGDVEGLSRTLSSAFVLYGGAGLLVIALTVLASVQFTSWFKVDPAHVDAARATLVLAGISLALGFPFGVFGAALSGLQRYDLANAIAILVAVVRALAFVVVLRAGGGLVELGWVALATNLIGHLLTWWGVRRLLPEGRLSLRLVDGAHLRLIGSYSGFAFVGALASTLAFKTDALVISAFMGTAFVTPFALVTGLIDNARSIVHNSTWVLSPTASEADTLGEKESLRQMLIHGSKYSVLLAWPALWALIVFGGNLLVSWMKSAEFASAAPLFVLLAVPTMIALPQSAANSILFGVGKHRPVVAIAIVNALVNLGLSILWVRPYGLVGVALGTAVPLVLISGVVTAFYASRALDLPLGRYLWRGTFQPGLVSLAFLGPALLVQALWRPMGLAALALAVGACWLVFAAVAWRFGLGGPERVLWAQGVGRVVGRLQPRPAAGGAGR